MFHELVSHNNDLRRLVEKGYAVAFDNGHLIVRDIPYLDSERQLQTGAIVTKLTFIDGFRISTPDDHQVFFAGSAPYGLDGTPIPNLGGGAATVPLKDQAVVVQRSFSNKPVDGSGFQNFFDKIESYASIISGPATALHNATPLTFRVDPNVVGDSVFYFHDTLSSRAEIGELSSKFKDEVVAIVGLGGTGAYLLDFLARTPVKEVRGFDADAYYVHNAYRSPGRLQAEELGTPKAHVYGARYESLRRGLSLHAKRIDQSSAADLHGVTFAFVCVDKGSSRLAVFDLLQSMKIPFIDVGMGLDRKRGALSGQVRTTYYPVERTADLRAMQLVDMSDAPDDVYRANVQIAELNALNACMAVIAYKQAKGFYASEVPFHHQLFSIDDLKLTRESF